MVDHIDKPDGRVVLLGDYRDIRVKRILSDPLPKVRLIAFSLACLAR